MHGDRVFVSDTQGYRIEVFTTQGAFVTAWGTRGSAPGEFIQPRGVAVGPGGRIYVADTWNDRIQVFGSVTTATKTSTWGKLKSISR